MMKQWLIAGAATAALLTGCSQGTPSTDTSTGSEVSETAVEATNPLLAEWDTPFGIPPFDLIEDSHYMPAIDVGIEELRADIAAIADNEEAPTFENTLVALEKAGPTLDRVSSVFGNITNTDTNDTLRALESEVNSKLTTEYNALFLNDKLFERVKTIYDNRESLGLDQQDLRLVELRYRDFVRQGAALDAEDKARVKEINTRLSQLSTQFSQNLVKETNGFELLITDEANLAGLSDAMIATGAQAAERKDKEGWLFNLNRSTFETFMAQSDVRDLRKKMFDGYRFRAANGGATDSTEIILEIARLRAERAELLGYKSHAHFQLDTRMARTPENTMEFLQRVWEPGLARAKEELADMQALVDATDAPYTVEGHDWWYLSEKVRADKFAFDAAALKPYFEMNTMITGMYEVMSELFDIVIEPVENAPKWNDVVTTWKVSNPDGSLVGIFMIDMYARDSKRGGAWMSTYRDASAIDGEVIRPIVTNNMNLNQPPEGDPTLMRFGEVETLYHEFGHALHGLLTTIKYPRFSGVSGPRDYTEFPAQILEHFINEPEILAKYAVHYETGEPIPQELIDKMRAAATFNQGFQTTEFIAASLLDMRWHMLSLEEANAITDVRAFEEQVFAEYGLLPEIEPRYRSPYFAHIFAGGYSAGYYAYLWSEILDADGFDAFKEAGDIFDPETAARLKTHVYEAGGLEPADELYRKFRGADPAIEPLLRVRGFLDE